MEGGTKMSKESTLTREELQKELKDVIRALGLYSNGSKPEYNTLYSALSQRFPLYTDESIPAATKQHMIEHNTCACADDKHVYLDTDRLKVMLDKAREEMGESFIADATHYYYDIKSLIVHEYTHILMRHLKRLQKFQKQSGNAKNIRTFQLACEIEANRGYQMEQTSNIYKMGVTEKAFPEVRGVYGLRNVYEVLKEHFGNDIDEQMEDNGAQDKGDDEGKSENIESSLSEAQKELLDKFKDDFEEQERQASSEASQSELEQEENETGQETSTSKGDNDVEESLDDIEVEDNDEAYDVLLKVSRKTLKGDLLRDLSTLKGIISGSNVSIGREKTYSRPSRREASDGLMKKGSKRGKHHAPTVLIGMDSSGSMNSTTMQEVMATVSQIIKATGKSMKGSYICEHDSFIKHLSPLYKYEDVVKGYRANGGNDFNALLRTALNCGVEVVINVGDGYDDLTDEDIMEQAKARGLHWVDVIINNTVAKCQIEELVRGEERQFGSNYIGRTILKIK